MSENFFFPGYKALAASGVGGANTKTLPKSCLFHAGELSQRISFGKFPGTWSVGEP